ncbi:unnamed protein product, partial [Amoebophrya sp. A25]|eukprot:GSA25T00025262001.1
MNNIGNFSTSTGGPRPGAISGAAPYFSSVNMPGKMLAGGRPGSVLGGQFRGQRYDFGPPSSGDGSSLELRKPPGARSNFNRATLLDGRFRWLNDQAPQRWGMTEEGSVFWMAPSAGRDYWRCLFWRDGGNGYDAVHAFTSHKTDGEAYLLALQDACPLEDLEYLYGLNQGLDIAGSEEPQAEREPRAAYRVKILTIEATIEVTSVKKSTRAKKMQDALRKRPTNLLDGATGAFHRHSPQLPFQLLRRGDSLTGGALEIDTPDKAKGRLAYTSGAFNLESPAGMHQSSPLLDLAGQAFVGGYNVDVATGTTSTDATLYPGHLSVSGFIQEAGPLVDFQPALSSVSQHHDKGIVDPVASMMSLDSGGVGAVPLMGSTFSGSALPRGDSQSTQGGKGTTRTSVARTPVMARSKSSGGVGNHPRGGNTVGGFTDLGPRTESTSDGGVLLAELRSMSVSNAAPRRQSILSLSSKGKSGLNVLPAVATGSPPPAAAVFMMDGNNPQGDAVVAADALTEDTSEARASAAMASPAISGPADTPTSTSNSATLSFAEGGNGNVAGGQNVPGSSSTQKQKQTETEAGANQSDDVTRQAGEGGYMCDNPE